MNIYFISGLGADQRVFQFLDLPQVNKIFIQWIIPHPNESLSQYASRLIEQINTREPVILIGISFGGIIAQEIARQIICEKVIVISSVKSPDEFSWALSLVRLTQVNRIVPPSILKWSNHATADYYFSVKSKAESRLLHQIIEDTDSHFSVWAIQQMMQWKPAKSANPIVHIHGTKDRIFPAGPIQNAVYIKDGGHFMIVNRSQEVSRLIQQELFFIESHSER